MMFDLSGMTALVTGASGGLGSSIAKVLAAQGARLAVSGSNVDKLNALPPNSTNSSTPAAAMLAMVSRQRTMPVTCSTSWRRITSGSLSAAAETFA